MSKVDFSSAIALSYIVLAMKLLMSHSGEQLPGGKGATAFKCRNLIYTAAVD